MASPASSSSAASALQDDIPYYDGSEQAISSGALGPPPTAEIYHVVHGPIPAGSTPVIDDETKEVVGFIGPWVQGMATVYDVDGHEIGRQEKGLETPLFDPIDVIVLGAGLLRLGSKLALEGIAAGFSAKLLARASATGFAAVLRAAFRAAVQKEIRFTATTAARMAMKGRFVPVNILKLALRYGTRTPDPRGVANAFRYTIKMFRNGKPYTLEVVVRETDWTILHFHYH